MKFCAFNRLATLLLALVFCLAGLSGCSSPHEGTSKTPGQDPNQQGNNENNKLVIMSIQATTNHFDEYIDNARAQTGLDIEVIAAPNNSYDRDAKFTTLLASGDESVDIFTINDEMLNSYIVADFLEPLQERVMTPDVVAMYPQEYVNMAVIQNEKVYTVPAWCDIYLYWVDQLVLNELQMQEPNNKAEFLSFVKAATKGSRFGYGDAWERNYIYSGLLQWITMFGGDYFDWHNAKTVEAMQFLYDMAHTHKVTPMAQIADQFDPMMQKAFDGVYASFFMFSGGISIIKDSGRYGEDQIHIAELPDFGNESTLIAAWHWILSKSSVRKEAAYKFLKYAASKKGQMEYSLIMDTLCVNQEAINDSEYKITGLEDVRWYINNTTLVARPYPTRSMEYVATVGSLFQKYISNEINLDTFCNQMQSQCDTYFERN